MGAERSLWYCKLASLAAAVYELELCNSAYRELSAGKVDVACRLAVMTADMLREQQIFVEQAVRRIRSMDNDLVPTELAGLTVEQLGESSDGRILAGWARWSVAEALAEVAAGAAAHLSRLAADYRAAGADAREVEVLELRSALFDELSRSLFERKMLET